MPPSQPADTGAERGEMLQGALDMLILKALQLEPMHGWGITERIHQWSDSVLQVNQGSLYPALYRLRRQGFITSSWKVTENNRRARYYAITPAGRKQLATSHASWRRIARAIDHVMQLAHA
jgi:transcriptional regulator